MIHISVYPFWLGHSGNPRTAVIDPSANSLAVSSRADGEKCSGIAENPGAGDADECAGFCRGALCYARLVACLAVAVGVAALLGWMSGVSWLTRLAPGFASVKPNTAACFVLLGIALHLQIAGSGNGTRAAAVVLAGVAGLVGFATAGQYLFGSDLGLDRLLFPDAVAAESATSPGRMAYVSAIGVALYGMSIVLMDWRWRGRWIFQVPAAAGGGLGYLCVVAYGYGIHTLYGFSSVALASAVLLALFGPAILLSRPAAGAMATVSSRLDGGRIARQMLPLALILPVALGALRLYGERAGLYGFELGLAIMAVANAIAFSAIVWFGGRALNRMAEENAIAHDRFRLAVEAAPNAMLMADSHGRIVLVNAQTEALFGYARAELLGQPVEMLLPAQFRAAHGPKRAAFQQKPSTRRMGAGRDLYGLRKDGWEVPVEIGLNPIRAPDGTYVLASIIDITERKQAEATLRESEARFRLMADSAPVLIWVSGIDKACTYVNRTWLEFTGRSLDNEVGQGWAERVHAADRLHCWDAYSRAFDRRQPFSVEFRLLRQDGQYRWLLCNGQPRFESSGGFSGYIGSCVDISDFRDTQQALRESEERLQTVVANLTEGLVLSELDGQVVHWNPAALEMHGFRSLDECRLRLPEFRFQFELSLLDGSVLDISEWPLPKIIRGERLRDYVVRIRRLDSSWDRIFSYGGSIVREPSGRQLAFLTITDITTRSRAEMGLRESEERFRQIAESINEVFWMTDVAKDRILYISPAYESIWGRTRSSLYSTPQNWLKAIHADDRARVRHSVINLQQLGEYDETYRIVRPDGAIRWIHDRAFPVRDRGGQVYRITGIAEDITEQRRLEEQLAQAQKLEAIGTLAGGIAHDFNNILTGIYGYAELARIGAGENTQVTEPLSGVIQAVHRARDLVAQMLAFSRRQESHRDVIRIEAVVEESVGLLRAAIPATIEIVIRSVGSIPRVLADPTQVQQMVMNIGTNAWHAMRDRGGQIEITLEEVEVDAIATAAQPDLRAGMYVRLGIRDEGHGMDAETMRRIFEPFFTTKAPGEGTGLGLSAVHGIMRNHDGAVTVTSQPGEGTQFHLYFPVHPDEVADAPAESPLPRGSGERVLVVDDEEPLAVLAQRLLQNLGYSAEAVTDPQLAIAALRERPDEYRILMTDYSMPGMTGLELARRARQARPGIAVVLSSGYNSRITPARMREGGIASLLPKPYTLDTLASSMVRALSGRPVSAHPFQPTADLFTPIAAGRARILVAEDDAMSRAVLGALLERLGCSADFCADGREAVERYAAERPEIVILDCLMPVMDGYEASREIRRIEAESRQAGEHRSSALIIALTASVLPSDRDTCLAAGMNEFVSKPVTLADLRSALSNWLPVPHARTG